MKVRVYFVGKPRDEHANAIAAEFLKRASRFAPCEMLELPAKKADPWSKHAAALKIAMDPAGKKIDSNAFAQIFAKLEMEGRDAVFLIGGHDGLPGEWKNGADTQLSLSPMTFPHELARAMLAEQIYRAFTILRGHPYPR
jgi:23S rRNA (pseudouridine1915-N3)-methyltransferase